ncbi:MULTISPECIES: OmpH family outer membrane protein [unclassified Imperialibacter]|uniref:OmpH family outer membrane protein n=1 Tax=unclassified Imperialibacter TaxID=2629706 RepID=UPI0012596C6C|nr:MULTISPECIES: OmpH family outer membrane protein [unclassified Imperialibacter]CAD5250759.1 Outer membrane chaperone Skp [Imperialibacter sp. 89]CAD5278946.1 Outer membrane chaperone Skp [Imperialibacter sp. 75]VVT02620.1 Periplasmic chaperone [Imperialibacter sp. EC-SDR9]
MKNLSTVLSVVLLAAVAVLFYLVLSNKAASSEPELANLDSSIDRISGDLSIAYVNSDTLLSKYEYFKDISSDLEKKRAKLESEYRNRAEGLQREIQNFQNSAQNMTMNQARAKEEELTVKQQNLYQYQQTLGQQLVEEETKLNEQLYNAVSGYLSEFSGSNKYHLVLTYTKGSGVLYADKRLDITDEVIKGLNKSYLQSKGVIPSDKTDSTATTK